MEQDLYGLQASGIDPEIAAQMLGLKRKRSVADALMQQALSPLKTDRVAPGGLAVPISPWEGIAQLAKAYIGSKGLEDLDKQQSDLTRQNQAKVTDALSGYMQRRDGTPETQMTTAVDDEGNTNPMVAGRAPDMKEAVKFGLTNNLLQNNPLVKMDAAAFAESQKPRVLGRTLVTGDGKTLATDSTWAEEQRAAQEARAAQGKAALEAKAAEAQANRDAAAERQREAAANREAQIRLMASLNPRAGQPVLTKGQEAADREFGKDYAQYQAAGGSADVEKQLRQLEQVSKDLGKEGNDYTGSVRGLVPDKIRAMTNPEAVAAKNKVEEVAQRNLRAVLGAQFTQVEGERLIARAYNDQLPPAENKRRVDALTRQIREAAKTKEDAARYFEKNGTLTGWKGRMPTLSDFESAIDGGGNTATGTIKGANQAVFDQADAIIGRR